MLLSLLLDVVLVTLRYCTAPWRRQKSESSSSAMVCDNKPRPRCLGALSNTTGVGGPGAKAWCCFSRRAALNSAVVRLLRGLALEVASMLRDDDRSVKMK